MEQQIKLKPDHAVVVVKAEHVHVISERKDNEKRRKRMTIKYTERDRDNLLSANHGKFVSAQLGSTSSTRFM